MLWLALQFPRLGLEVWATNQKNNRPIVLLEGSRIVLCNLPALEAGIVSGSTLATAHSIVSTLEYFHRDASREHSRLEFLAETLYRFSAQISLEPPDGLVIEVGASLELFGSAAHLARKAWELCVDLGHETRWQLAGTPGAALVMARTEVRRLEDVPLAHARIPAAGRNVERLANMGMHTLAPLLQLPEIELGQRFGPEMVAFLGRLVGRIPDPRRFIKLSPQFDQALHLLEPVRDKETLIFPIQRLLNELSHWLVTRQLGAEQLTWSFSTHTKADHVVLPLKFARAQQSKDAFLSIVRLKLEQIELPSDILNIQLKATRLIPWLSNSRNLFQLLSDQDAGDEPDNAMNRSDASELIDQLCARLGENACSGIASKGQHAPESAWQPVRSNTQTARQTSTAPDLPRPLWLFDPPHLTDRKRLTLLKGPERIQTDWWRQTIWRDYYVAVLESGAKCWAFIDAQGRWYLHGYFG